MTRCWPPVRRRKRRGGAAEAVAGYENRFIAIDQRLAKMDSEFNQRFAKIEGDIKLLTWMVGFNLAATVGVFFLLLRH
jgi:hypothetical protein